MRLQIHAVQDQGSLPHSPAQTLKGPPHLKQNPKPSPWPLRLYRMWSAPPNACPTRPFCFCHSGHLVVPQIVQGISQVQSFALAGPLSRTFFPQIFTSLSYSLHSGICQNFTSQPFYLLQNNPLSFSPLHTVNTNLTLCLFH